MRIGLSIVVRKRRMTVELIVTLRLRSLKAENMKINTRNQSTLIETKTEVEVDITIKIIREGEAAGVTPLDITDVLLLLPFINIGITSMVRETETIRKGKIGHLMIAAFIGGIETTQVVQSQGGVLHHQMTLRKGREGSRGKTRRRPRL
jgi:hypothetical protein